MNNSGLLETHYWHPFAQFGFTHSFFAVESTIVLHTWIILLLMVALLIPARMMLSSKKSITRFLLISYVNSFIELCEQTLGMRSHNHFCFITTLFTLIVFCNAISVIPGLEEPTQSINTTLAFGLISFFYVQAYQIKQNGFIGYLKDYTSPFFLMLPLNIIGKVASIISISFRLFGNIFGGSIIARIYFGAIQGSLLWESVGLFSGINLLMTLFFGLFEGLLQAFVFAALTLTYLSLAIGSPETEPEETGAVQ